MSMMLQVLLRQWDDAARNHDQVNMAILEDLIRRHMETEVQH